MLLVVGGVVENLFRERTVFFVAERERMPINVTSSLAERYQRGCIGAPRHKTVRSTCCAQSFPRPSSL